VEAEKGRHDGERDSDENRTAVGAARPDDGEGQGGAGRERRGQGDAEEVDAAADLHLLAPEEVEERRRCHREERRKSEDWDRTFPHETSLSARMRAESRR
jgi:hypothetical protein